MARAFEEVIALQLERFGPEGARQKHIQIARKGLAAFLARQQSPPDVSLVVDMHPASSEQQVRPFGVITYNFLRTRPAALFAKAQAIALSPIGHEAKPRHYRDSWFFLVDDKECPDNALPQNGRVILTNDQPYSRKINVGSKGFERYAPPGIVEKVRQLVLKKYGASIDARVEFITLAGGHRLRTPLRRGRQIEHEVTYPSLIMAPKGLI